MKLTDLVQMVGDEEKVMSYCGPVEFLRVERVCPNGHAPSLEGRRQCYRCIRKYCRIESG